MMLMAVTAMRGAPPMPVTAHVNYAQSTLQSSFVAPAGVATDANGNLYVADVSGTIFKETPDGSGGYTQTDAQKNVSSLNGLAVDANGNMYFANGSAIYKDTANGSGGYTQTIVQSGFTTPSGVAVDANGAVYVTDQTLKTVYKETPNGSGDYTQTTVQAGFTLPMGVGTDVNGNVYVADNGTTIYKETPNGSGGYVQSLIQEGLSGIGSVAVDADGAVYVASQSMGMVYKETPSSVGVYAQTTIQTGFSFPYGIAVDTNGNVYVTNLMPGAVYKLHPGGQNFYSVPVATASVTRTLTFTFDWGGTINAPAVLTMGAANQDFVDAGTGSCTTNGTTHTYNAGDTCTVDVIFTPKYAGQRMGAVELTTGSPATLVGMGQVYGTGTGPQVALTPGKITSVAGSGSIGYNGDNRSATSASLFGPTSVAVDGAGNLYIADYRNNRIRRVDAGSGVITTVAGNGTAGYTGDGGLATSAELNAPQAVAVDGAGNLYIADTDNSRLRKVDTSGTITTVAGTASSGYNGDNQLATSASLYHPQGVTVDGAGNVYITDTGDARIRKIDVSGMISTVAGGGSPSGLGDGGLAINARLFNPLGVAVDGNGNLYIADSGNQRVRKVAPSGIITTVAGTGTQGYNGDNQAATSAELDNPDGLAVDGAGNLYIADAYNYRVRKVDTSGTISTVAGNGTFGHSGDNGPATQAEISVLYGVALDSVGNLFLTDYSIGYIRKVDVSTTSSSFATATNVGSTDSQDGLQTTLVSNIGNAPLTFAVPASGSANPSFTGSSFSIDSSATCPQLTSSSAAATLASGSSCTLPVSFTPQASGSLSGSLVLTDDNLNIANAQQTITLSGTGLASLSATTTVGSTELTLNTAATAFTPVTGSGGTAPLTYAITAGTLPAGLSFDASTGEISGTPTATSTATTYTVTVTDANSQTATANFSLTVDAIPATVTLGNLAATYDGTPHAATVTTNPAGLSVTIFYSTPGAEPAVIRPHRAAGTTTAPTAAGSYTVFAYVNDPDYTGSATGTLVIAQAPVTVGLTASTATVTPGQAITLTATVASKTSGTPTGTVTFLNGTTTLGTATLSGGQATLSFTPATAGSYAITASYGGDTNFLSGVSTASLSLTAGSTDFTLTPSSTGSTQAVTAGQTATFTFAATPSVGVFSSPVTFSLSGLPQGASATFSPASFAAGSTGGNVTLTVQTAAVKASLRREAGGVAMALLLLPLAGLRRVRRRLGAARLLMAVLMLAGMGAMTGCGGSAASSIQSNLVTITASSGQSQHSITVLLNVQ